MIFQHNSSNIYYTDRGQGPVVVLLHGFLLRSTFWEPLVKELLKKHRVLCIDLPGHGKSDVVANEQSMELMAVVVRELLMGLGIPSSVFIGHSMGGYVSLAILEFYKELVDGIILLNSTTKADTPERRLSRERALEILPENPNSFITIAIRNLFTTKNAVQFRKEIKRLQADAKKFPLDGILAMTRGMMLRKDRTDILKEFKGPKLIICGNEDPIVPMSESEIVAKATNCDLKIVNGGHMILIENWSDFIKIVHFIDFL